MCTSQRLGIRQNDVMKMLTIVTTIFLPLTLSQVVRNELFLYAGIKMPDGISDCDAVSILIVILSLWTFKKKKYW